MTAPSYDPALPYELDNTPWWVQDSEAGMGPRCNPYGYETDDVRVLGGLRNPANEQHVWYCRNKADGRWFMTCAYGHKGAMRLCYAHVGMIQRRMTGICPRCSHPDAYRDLEKAVHDAMRYWLTCHPREKHGVGQRINYLTEQIDEMIRRGEIRTGAPLRLSEVS
jgi:hypothetical protein